jgi:hypothetical protein
MKILYCIALHLEKNHPVAFLAVLAIFGLKFV